MPTVQEEKQGFNVEYFRQILRKAIGDRSQAEFAREAGISPEHLSRLLRKDKVGRPDIDTIKKFAVIAHNGVTLEELAGAAGYTDEEVFNPFKANKETKDFEEEPENEYQFESMMLSKLMDGLRTIVMTSPKFGSCEEVLETFENAHSNGSYAFDMGGTAKDEDGELLQEVTASWYTEDTVTEVPFALRYTQTKNGIKLKGVEYSASELDDYHILPDRILKALEGENLENYNPAQIIVDNSEPLSDMTAEERLLTLIFGDDVGKDYINTDEGFGFRIKEYDQEGQGKPVVSEDTIRDFLRKHKKAYCTNPVSKEIYEMFVTDNAPEEEVVTQYPALAGSMMSAVASVIWHETNLYCQLYSYDKDDDSFQTYGTPEVVMVPVEVMDDPEEECKPGSVLAQAMNKYAGELGIKKYGRQYFTRRRMMSKVNQYTVEEVA